MASQEGVHPSYSCHVLPKKVKKGKTILFCGIFASADDDDADEDESVDQPEVGEHDQSEDVDKVQPLPERCHHYKSLQINVIVISIFFIIDLSTLTKVSCGTSCTRSRAQVPLTYRSLSVKWTPNEHKNCALLTIWIFILCNWNWRGVELWSWTAAFS